METWWIQVLTLLVSQLRKRIEAQVVYNLISLVKRLEVLHSNFVTNIHSACRCVATTRKDVDKHLQGSGFVQIEGPETKGSFKGTVYHHDPVDVIWNKYFLANEDKTMFQPVALVKKGGVRKYSHVMETPFVECELEKLTTKSHLIPKWIHYVALFRPTATHFLCQISAKCAPTKFPQHGRPPALFLIQSTSHYPTSYQNLETNALPHVSPLLAICLYVWKKSILKKSWILFLSHLVALAA